MNNELSDNFSENNQNYSSKLLHETSKSILESTIQFFSDNSKGKQSPTASGLLVCIANRYFILTAAHVIAEHSNDIEIVIPPNKLLRPGGVLYFTPLPISGNRIDDKLDFAVMELEDSVVSEVSTVFKFITLDDIDFRHKTVSEPCYLSVGYPVTKTKKIWGKGKISAVPFPYLTEPNPSFNFENFGFSSKTHIAVQFDGKVTSEKIKQVHKAPKMEGISGSGLWYVNHLATDSTSKRKKLVGLIIEVNNKALIATRIEVIIETIQHYFDLDIPAPIII